MFFKPILYSNFDTIYVGGKQGKGDFQCTQLPVKVAQVAFPKLFGGPSPQFSGFLLSFKSITEFFKEKFISGLSVYHIWVLCNI